MRVFVEGVPAPKGSMRAYVRGGHASITHDNRKTKPWQDAVRGAVALEMSAAGIEPMDCAVAVHCVFYLPRPKSAKKRTYPHTKPDLDKCQRVIGDALEGTLLTNDSRIVDWNVSKRYASNKPGVFIFVEAMGAA